MKLGIVGLPNVGKSTLFNAITEAGAECANYPFCTIEPNIGVVPVPDERLNKLAKMYHPKKTTPTVIEFVDIAGLVKGASRGEGLGNKFLSHIREVDAIVHVVRCFEDENVTHVDGTIDPIRDIENLNLELLFADLESTEKRIERTKRMAKSGDKRIQAGLELLIRIKENLENGIPARNMKLNDAEKHIMSKNFLLTSKPIIYAANIGEDDLGVPEENLSSVKKVIEYASREDTEVLSICAKIEEEIAQMDWEEKSFFLEELEILEPGLDRLIKACYRLLGLISFFTVNENEARAWTILKGTKALEAAAKVHTDFQRGFIKAEVISFDLLMKSGSYNLAREKGLVNSEGKEYIVNDGDVILFRFNV